MNLGNTELRPYGIQNEKTDWRAHVGFVVNRIYSYRTQNGVRALSRGREAPPPRQNGIITARGKLVRPEDIEGCVWCEIPKDIRLRRWVPYDAGESRKGEAAMHIVREMVQAKHGYFMFEETDKAKQIEGTDILVSGATRVQVKCDYRGGAKELGGTGNLFLQTHECNPFGRH